MLIDTHSHIDGEEYDDDREEVIGRAKEAGVGRILVPNINGKTISRIVELCESHKGYLYPMIGLHPEDVTDDDEATLDEMENMLNTKHDFIAIGEVGLDLYWDTSREREQIKVFERQVEWAEKYSLPLMIHSRNAHKQLVDIISRHDSVKGVFHCFTGTKEEAAQLLSFKGFKLGIGGVVTFKKSQLPSVLSEAVPLDRIVLETDAPYMAPVPHRGKRNESSFIVEVARKLSEIYSCGLDEVAKTTTENAIEVFPTIA